MKKYRFILCLGWLWFAWPTTSPVAAADFSLTVSPSFLVLNTTPGQTTTGTVRVQNNGSNPSNLSVDLLKIKSTGDSDQLLLEPVGADDEFRRWVSFDTDQLAIAPGRSQTITLTVTAPEHAALGYYYALAFQDSDQAPEETTTVVTGVTAVPILLEVIVPQAQRSLIIQNFSSSRRLYDFLPATFSVTLKNSGNVHIAPRGNIFINRFGRNEDQNDLAVLDVNNDTTGGYILPGTARTFTAQWSDGFPHYTTTTDQKNSHLVWDWGRANTLRAGKYTATLVMVYDNINHDESVEGALSFWIFPWQFVLIGLLLLILLYNLKSWLRAIARRLHRVIGGLAVLILISQAMPAQAINYQQPFSLTISPYFLSLRTIPGGSVTDIIHLKNNSPEAVTLETDLMRFRSYNDQGMPELLPLATGDTFSNWISYSADRFTIDGGGSYDLSITIAVPPDAALGYYYALAFKKASATEGEETTKLLGSSAVLILLEVDTPGITKDVQLMSFAADRVIFDYLPVTFRVTLKNQGNIHVAPGGNIFIDQGSKKDVGIIDVNTANGNVLPDSTRVFSAGWDDGFPVRRENKLRWDVANASHFRIGKYTANLLMIYDNGTADVPITGTLSFWVIPWQLLLVSLLILSLAGVGLLSVIKRFGRPSKKRAL